MLDLQQAPRVFIFSGAIGSKSYLMLYYARNLARAWARMLIASLQPDEMKNSPLPPSSDVIGSLCPLQRDKDRDHRGAQ